MRFKFTAFLLVLNAIAFGLIAFLNHQAQENGPQINGLSGRIGREVIEADRIELQGLGLEAPLVLTRKGSTWAITEPIQWPANFFAVNRILNQLQFLEEDASFSVEEIAKTGQGLEDYGLKNPLLKLTIGSGKDNVSLSIGSPTDIGNNVYLLGPENQKIYVVGRKVIDSLQVDRADLRSRKIFEIPVFEVEALGLQIRTASTTGNGELKVRIARTGTGWILEAPLNAEADPSRVSNVINTLSAVKVGRFIEQDASDTVLQGLESPFMRVTLQGNKRQQTLLLGNKDPAAQGEPTYFARLEDNPTVFTVQAAPFDELRKAQEDLRERNFMNFDPAALNAIHITEGDLQIRLQKLETGEWQVIRSDSDSDINPHRADDTVMLELMKSLKGLRASGFASDSPTPTDLERFGFNTPRRSITLINANGSETTLLLAHPEEENKKLYARLDGTDFIYEVERRPTLTALSLNELKYRNRTLDTLPEAARIQSIKLENLESGTVVFEYSQNEAFTPWAARLAKLPDTERTAILQLIEDIRNFKVKNYLFDRYQDAYPVDKEKTLPWTFRLTAQILLPGDEAALKDERSYVFTKRLSGTVQAGSSAKQNTIFEIQQATLDALYALTEDMPLPPEATGEPVPAPKAVDPVPAPATPAIPADT